MKLQTIEKAYIGGKITGLDNYKELFELGALWLKRTYNAKVMNPAILPDGFEHHEYMNICYPMIDACDTVAFLPNWADSKGAIMEYAYAQRHGKNIIFIPKDIFDTMLITEAIE